MIRQATSDDISAMVYLGELMHGESPRFSRCEYKPEKLVAMADHVLGGNGVAFVVEVGGEIVGMMVGLVTEHFFSDVRIGTDLALYIAPEHRGGRHVVALVKAFEARAVELGASEIELGVSTGVHADRTAALYEALGYKRNSIGLVKYV